MELFIFARFHARPGDESAVAEAILENMPPSRAEPGCLNIHAYRSIRDPRLFYIHSRWKDETAFEEHAGCLDPTSAGLRKEGARSAPGFCAATS